MKLTLIQALCIIQTGWVGKSEGTLHSEAIDMINSEAKKLYLKHDLEIIEYKGKGEHSVKELEKLVEDLNKELKVTDELYNDRQKLVDAIDDISECTAHGRNCIHNALEWINKKKRSD